MANFMLWLLVAISSFVLNVNSDSQVELTFELPPLAEQCFYEDLRKDVSTTFQFTVVDGGRYDIDVEVTAPNIEIIYKEVLIMSDIFIWIPSVSGSHSFCFSNKFSIFTKKRVYASWQTETEMKDVSSTFMVIGVPDNSTTQTEKKYHTASMQTIHYNLIPAADYQTHKKLMETRRRKRVEYINENDILIFKFGSLIAILITMGQMVLLKKLITDKLLADEDSETESPLHPQPMKQKSSLRVVAKDVKHMDVRSLSVFKFGRKLKN